MATTKSNGTNKQAAPVGTLRRTLQEPKVVGEVTIAELNEIRERSRLIDTVAKQIDEFNVKVLDASRIRALLDFERSRSMVEICKSHGLPEDNEYRIDTTSGTILLVAESAGKPVPDTDDIRDVTRE